jgi:hypothetical protein
MIGAEPASDGLGMVHEHERAVRATWRDAELFRYVYRPWDPPVESPRPYLHPVRTLSGRLVSLYRPHDHVWHKGISLALSNVGAENFWGGPTYVRGHDGYVQLPNNGSMRHTGFDALATATGLLRLDERLSWVTEAGGTLVAERRRMGVRVVDGAWQLAFETTMDNVSGAPIVFGSPTTQGRDNAGYSGLLWRGPRSFSGGTVITPDAVGGDDLMGWRGPWLAFVGRHDGDDGAATLLFTDHPTNPTYPNQWFVRSNPFAAVCPAPFFGKEYELPAGAALTLRYDVFVADGALDHSACAGLAGSASGLALEATP